MVASDEIPSRTGPEIQGRLLFVSGSVHRRNFLSRKKCPGIPSNISDSQDNFLKIIFLSQGGICDRFLEGIQKTLQSSSLENSSPLIRGRWDLLAPENQLRYSQCPMDTFSKPSFLVSVCYMFGICMLSCFGCVRISLELLFFWQLEPCGKWRIPGRRGALLGKRCIATSVMFLCWKTPWRWMITNG